MTQPPGSPAQPSEPDPSGPDPAPWSRETPQPPPGAAWPAPPPQPAPAPQAPPAPQAAQAPQAAPAPQPAPAPAPAFGPGTASWPTPPVQGPPTQGLPATGALPAGAAYPQPYPPPPGGAATLPRSRRALVVTLVLAIVVLLCGGGGTGAYVLLQRLQGQGQDTPTAAVEGFLTATTRHFDANEAARFVCPDARKKADLTKKITELRGYQDKYKGGFEWTSPVVEKSDSDRATVTAKLTFSNTDEQSAEQTLTFLTVNDSGWWVCEISGTK